MTKSPTTRVGGGAKVPGMGFVTESQIRQQAKKGQGETNQRLEAILAAIEEQTTLLRQLVEALAVRR